MVNMRPEVVVSLHLPVDVYRRLVVAADRRGVQVHRLLECLADRLVLADAQREERERAAQLRRKSWQRREDQAARDRLRGSVLSLYRQGCSPTVIGEHLGLPVKKIYYELGELRKVGLAEDLRSGGAHPMREQVRALLEAGKSTREISTETGLSKEGVKWHKHMIGAGL